MTGAGATASTQLDVSPAVELQRFVLLAVAEETFALHGHDVTEILPLPELARPAHLPPITEGLLNLGGQIIPVVRLRGLLGFDAATPGVYAHLILVKLEGASIALLADRAIDCISVARDRLKPLVDGELYRDCVSAELAGFPHAVHVLDLERLLSARERQILKALSGRELEHQALFEDAE